MRQTASHPGAHFHGLMAGNSAGDAATAAIEKQQCRILRAAKSETVPKESQLTFTSLRNFFLAVTFRSNGQPRTSATFDRCVLATQIAVVVLMLAALFPAAKPMVTAAPPEIAVIEAWMADQYEGPVKIRDYGDPRPNPNGPGVAMQVSYRYHSSNHKAVSTSQWFLIENDQVTSVDSEL